MTSIPPYAGVPAVLGNAWVGGVPAGQIISGDLVSAAEFAFGSPQWGLYVDGAPAVVFETFVSLDYRQEYAIADYPLEDGGFESFNKVQVPYNVRVRLSSGGSLAAREALLGSVQFIAGDLNLYTVVTPDAVYDKVNVQRVDYRRESQSGNGVITVEIYLMEIRTRVVETTTGVSAASGAVGATAAGSGTLYDLVVTPNTGTSLITKPALPSGASIFNDGYVSPFDSAFQAFSPSQIRNDPARGFTVY